MNIYHHFNHSHGYFRDDYDSGTALSHQDVEDVEKVGKYLTFFSRVDLAIFVARTCFQNIFGSVEINWKHFNDFCYIQILNLCNVQPEDFSSGWSKLDATRGSDLILEVSHKANER